MNEQEKAIVRAVCEAVWDACPWAAPESYRLKKQAASTGVDLKGMMEDFKKGFCR
jgi:hypothetical protein